MVCVVAGKLDEIAQVRGITDTPADEPARYSNRPPPGAMMGPGMQGMGPSMGPPPPGAPWQRGMVPGGPMGMGMPGMGVMMSGPPHMGPGGVMYGMQNGPMSSMGGQMAGGGMRGGPGTAGASSASQSARPLGAGGGADYQATYNVMPASQLELDARGYDKPLLDKTDSHLQLLQALMRIGDWEHALLMLDWLQVGYLLTLCSLPGKERSGFNCSILCGMHTNLASIFSADADS